MIANVGVAYHSSKLGRKNKMKKSSLAMSVLVAVALMFNVSAFAGVMLSPVSATASLSTESTYPDCTIDKIIDQSGLNTTFISGVTNYATYMGFNPTHNTSYKADCYVSENDEFGNGLVIDLDLGAAFELEHMIVWNGNVNGGNSESGIKNVVITVSENSGYSNPTTLKSVIDEAGDPIAPFVVDFGTAVSAQYVKIEVYSNYGNSGHYDVSEVAFDVVPEPLSIALMGLGGWIVSRKRTVK